MSSINSILKIGRGYADSGELSSGPSRYPSCHRSSRRLFHIPSDRPFAGFHQEPAGVVHSAIMIHKITPMIERTAKTESLERIKGLRFRLEL
jgi:hypothetical protein